MINNSSLKKWHRITAKSIDAQFLHEMQHGLNCSPFEAQIIVEKVHEHYEPLWDVFLSAQPGQIRVVVIDIDVPAGAALKESKQKTVTVTLIDNQNDANIREAQDVPALRQHRICRICEEAFQQGGLFTIEDISLLFNCGIRTIVNDLNALRSQEIMPALRSNVKDIGRAITHRKKIVTLWLKGKEYSDIAFTTKHSVQSVANYVGKYKRVVALLKSGFDINTTAFLTRLSPALATKFQEIYESSQPVEHRQKELEDFLKKSHATRSLRDQRGR